MIKTTGRTLKDIHGDVAAHIAAMNAAHAESDKIALLEHARMGRSVCEGRDGKVVWIEPAEIFARYGLDEFGRPLPATTPPA